ncbi:MAG: RsmE family RNA methyltransferase [Balneolales bacterium]
MNLFYTQPEKVQEHRLTITGDEARHVIRVLRFKTGDPITVTDGKGNRYEGRIESSASHHISVSIENHSSEAKPYDLILALGIIKNRQRLEFAVEKAVELGATEVILFKSTHSERQKVNLDRLQAIALSAMKQSLRSYLPPVVFKKSLGDAISGHSSHDLIVGHEKQKSRSPAFFELNKNHLVLIGPEGGFSDEEIHFLTEKRAAIVSLGKYRLRSETAAAALLSRFT